jgi:ATP-dependent RNA helicase SUPV3L1/SUV3
MTGSSLGLAPSRLVAVLGPTNTGKTHLAVERMLGHASGMIGLPLRLLAREVYDRIVAARGPKAVALITGEEKIVPPRPHYFVCTVEAMPLAREVEFLAIDEIQLAADPERGHVFTQRLLHARGCHETMFLGAATMAPLIRRLLPTAEVVMRERFSALSYAGQTKLSRLPRRSAVVAFSAEQVYAIAELIRRQRGGAAVVMGSLSPRTRNAQVALYQSGEVDFLVATDAIGMGLNMDVDHVAFAGLTKFDGKRLRHLHAQEIGQIAGRAGRYRTDGTFGLTAGCDAVDDGLIAQVEHHRFEAIEAAQWRNGALDLSSLANLLRSLAAPAPEAGLKASEEALDETVLRALAADEEIARRCADRSAMLRLWDACQTPDFRKTTLDDHIRLVRDLFGHLVVGHRRVPHAWMAERLTRLDRLDGEIDALSTRLAGVRTLAYVANRQDWLADATHWRETTRVLETRLSDTLHEKLMARFVDRRTSALLRGLGQSEDLLAGVAADGTVTVEGHFVGRLRGLNFEAARGAGALEQKALRAAADRAVAPEINRRLGRLASESDEAFSLDAGGLVLWRGEAAGALTNDQPFNPQVRLLGEMGAAPARQRAARRLEAFVAAESGRRLGPLKSLSEAVTNGSLRGLARGVAWRLIEAGGLIDRRTIAADLASLSQAERRALRALGVQIGAFSVHLPALRTPDAALFARAFASAASSPVRELGLSGQMEVTGVKLPVDKLERLDDILRRAPRRRGAPILTETARDSLGWTPAEAARILRGLGLKPVRGAEPGDPIAWRRTAAAPREATVTSRPSSPFAALQVLKAPPARKPRRKWRSRAARG